MGSDSSADELSLLNTESSPAVDRVSEYENKSRSQSDFGFIVIPSTKESSLSIDAFPNGAFCPITGTNSIMCLTYGSQRS